MYRSPLKILQKKTPGFAGNPQSLWHISLHSMQRVFFRCNPLFVLLTLQIISQGQAEHDTTFETS